MNADVVAVSVSVIELGRCKDIFVGERVSKIFSIVGEDNELLFYCRTTTGVLLSDKIGKVNSLIVDQAKLIWEE